MMFMLMQCNIKLESEENFRTDFLKDTYIELLIFNIQ